MTLCKNNRCKSILPPNAKFCPFCGKPQNAKRRSKRANGSGTVAKRPGVKGHPWMAYGPSIATYDHVTGKSVRKRPFIGNFATQAEALAALEAYKVNPTTDLTITLAQIYERWSAVAYRDLSKASVDGYKAAWIKLRPLHKSKMADLRTGDYQAIIDYYDNEHPEEGAGGQIADKDKVRPPLSRSTLSKIKLLANQLNNYALSQDIVKKNYVEFVSLPPAEDAKRERFTDLELYKIEKAAGDIYDLIFIMCHTGHRVGEFLTITKADIREQHGALIIRGGNKTDSGRNKLVPVGQKIDRRVRRWLARNGQTVFCREDGSPWSTDNFRDHMVAALEQIGVRPLTPHACRRTFATRLSAAGVSPQDMIALMGHTDFAVDIEHYINQEAGTLLAAVNRL